MKFLRRHLGACAIGWLLWQTASLSALAPMFHDEAESTEQCDLALTGDQCPMRGADGTPCPMHRAAASHAAVPHGAASHKASHSTSHDAASECRIRALAGTEEAAALATLFSLPGIMPEKAVVNRMTSTLVPMPVGCSLLTSPLSLDTPPPRA